MKLIVVFMLFMMVNVQAQNLTTINVPGYRLVQYTKIQESTIVLFEPAIARSDSAMSDAFLEIGEKVFSLSKSQLPIQDIVSTPKGNAIRYKYKSKSLKFLPMKNDDGTIHTVMVSVD